MPRRLPTTVRAPPGLNSVTTRDEKSGKLYAAVVPVTRTLGVGPSFSYTFSPYSVTLPEVNAA